MMPFGYVPEGVSGVAFKLVDGVNLKLVLHFVLQALLYRSKNSPNIGRAGMGT